MTALTGPAALALESLTQAQREFLQNIPKYELHAHLNGSIPLPYLQSIARERLLDAQAGSQEQHNAVTKCMEILENGVELNEITDFFDLFPAIYALTSSPRALATVAREVLSHFLLPGTQDTPQCQYIELRTTPRNTEHMTREEYLVTVLDEIDKFPADAAALIVSIDRRMSVDDVLECMDLAISLKHRGRRVVGVDLCGDPLQGDMTTFSAAFSRARESGLGITLHIAETPANTEEDTLTLLSFSPSRLGHATFLSSATREIVLREKIPIEICLTSNLLCKTVKTINAHHIRFFIEHNHPIAICTDDVLPFRTSLLGEYALLMAAPPLGLGLTEDEIMRVAEMGRESRFF